MSESGSTLQASHCGKAEAGSVCVSIGERRYNSGTMGTLLKSTIKAGQVFLLVVLLATPLGASEMGAKMAARLGAVEDKIVGLAKAIPDKKYGWSPSDEVRTVSQLLMHVASANHFFASRLGGSNPPAHSGDWEQTITTKAAAVAKLRDSFAAVKDALKGADLNQATKLFGGREGTLADFGLIALGHGHEHLGQLIAYARANNVTPPWSE